MADSIEFKQKLSEVSDELQVIHSAPDIDEEELDLDELIGVLIENRWLIVAIVLAALALGGFKAWTATPIYQADGLLQVEAKQSALNALETRDYFDSDPMISAEIEILKSRSVLGTVVDDLKLEIMAAPIYMPYIGAALARRLPAGRQPRIEVDSLDISVPVTGQALTLVARGSSIYDVLDENGNQILRGKVGEMASGAGISLSVSKLQGDEGQRFTIGWNEGFAWGSGHAFCQPFAD